MKKTVNQFLTFMVVAAQISSPAMGYVFNANPKTWSDADVESFMFLSQVQQETALGRNSRLCVEVSEPVPGGKQQMRIVSKVGDNKEGGLFVTGKSEIGKGGAGESDLKTIKKIVDMASGYQQAIMDYDDSTGTPRVRDKAELMQYMTAEVIGYTDGQGIIGSVSGSLDGNGKTYTSNKELGMQRATYLADELGLKDSFQKVAKRSIESETAMKGKQYKEIRDCATWRTAEVKMTFQTGSKVTDDSTWAMSTKMAPEQQRLMMQYDAAKQVQESLAALSTEMLYTTTVDPNDNTKIKRMPKPELASLCKLVLSDMKAFDPTAYACSPIAGNACILKCKDSTVYINTGYGNSGGPFVASVSELKNGSTDGMKSIDKKILTYISKDKQVSEAIAGLTKTRKDNRAAQLKKDFPACAANADTFKDLETMADQVSPVANECYVKSPHRKVGPGNKCAQAAIIPAPDKTGMSGKLMKCLSMKRMMNFMYSQGECRPGSEFNKVTFPHMNALLGCKYCGNGWSTKDGKAQFSERYDGKITHFHDTNATSTNPTYSSLQSPSIHEIADCADCSCTGKNEKLKKVFLVEEASSTKSVIDSIDKTSCYCTPPVAPSCGVGPQGSTAEAKYSSLGQKWFYNACTKEFVPVKVHKGLTDQKNEQIVAMYNEMTCAASGKTPCKNMDEAITKVNGMMCETQKYKIPTDDPIADCSQEDGVKIDEAANLGY